MCWSIFIVVSLKVTPLQQKLTYLDYLAQV